MDYKEMLYKKLVGAIDDITIYYNKEELKELIDDLIDKIYIFK